MGADGRVYVGEADVDGTVPEDKRKDITEDMVSLMRSMMAAGMIEAKRKKEAEAKKPVLATESEIRTFGKEKR